MSRKICVTFGCGKFQVTNARCAGCAEEYEAARGTRHERGYGTAHEKNRRRLLSELKMAEARGIVLLCWRCEEPMHSWQKLHADHSTVLASEGGRADVLAHAACNTGKRVPTSHR